MKTVQILAQYPLIEIPKDSISFDAEEGWSHRPAWIRLNDVEELPRFLSIQVPKHGELIYKSFGKYYYPFDYTNDEEQRFMNGMAQDYDQMVGQAFNIPMAKALLEKIPLAQVPHSAQVLDLGCGTGILSEILSLQGYTNLTLVDFSQGMLAVARDKTALKDANFMQADVTEQIPPGSYSLVASVMLFNTFDEETTHDILKRLAAHLNSEALLAVLEDTKKPAYEEYFEPIFSGMVGVSDRTKYVFVGRIRET